MTDGGEVPYTTDILEEGLSKDYGVTISAQCKAEKLTESDLRESIGSRFLVDPDFAISLNGTQIELLSLKTVSTHGVLIPDNGEISILSLDSPAHDRKIRLRCITYWVGNRMVGEPSGQGLEADGGILDGSTTAAKKYSFVVLADVLRNDVSADWTRFQPNLRTQVVRTEVNKWVLMRLLKLSAGERKEKKANALRETRTMVRSMTELSRSMLSDFIDEVLEKCPKLSEGDLIRAVEIFGKLEQARSGDEILKTLARRTPDDIDTWKTVMENWQAKLRKEPYCLPRKSFPGSLDPRRRLTFEKHHKAR